MTTLALARTLTRETAAGCSLVSPRVVREWCADGTIPSTYIVGADGSTQLLTPAVIALFVIADKLNQYLGPKNPITRRVIQQIAPQVLRAWHGEPLARLRIVIEGLTLLLDVEPAIREARERVATMT